MLQKSAESFQMTNLAGKIQISKPIGKPINELYLLRRDHQASVPMDLLSQRPEENMLHE